MDCLDVRHEEEGRAENVRHKEGSSGVKTKSSVLFQKPVSSSGTDV